MRPVDVAQRLEWAVAGAAAVLLYAAAGSSWWLFAALILAPDLSMLGYLAGPRAGALSYNALHVLVWPLPLALAGFWLGGQTALAVGLIWIAHIAMDRALGYGLKLASGFQDTHLGRIGRNVSP